MHNQRGMFSLIYLIVIFGLSTTGMGLFLANQDTPVPPSWGTAGGIRGSLEEWAAFFFLSVVLPVAAGIFGVLILRQDTKNKIGRWLCLTAVIAELHSLLGEFAVYGYYTTALPGMFHAWAAWFTNWLWLLLFVSILWIMAIFPNGSLLPGFWRWTIRIVLTLFIGPIFLGAMSETQMSSAFGIQNPLQVPFLSGLYDYFMTLGVFFMIVSILLITSAVIVRFQRQTGLQRQQIKWLLAGVGLMAVMVVVGLGLGYGLRNMQGQILVNISFLGPLVGVGVAILRYRLYDIDFILRRTLQYSLLTGLLTLVYFGGVALLQRLISAVGGQSSAIIIVITTLLIAALFNPLRRRLQDFIDRRFYRQKYDAEQALADFAESARSETDLEQLSTRLTATVQETLQPEQVVLWLPALKRER